MRKLLLFFLCSIAILDLRLFLLFAITLITIVTIQIWRSRRAFSWFFQHCWWVVSRVEFSYPKAIRTIVVFVIRQWFSNFYFLYFLIRTSNPRCNLTRRKVDCSTVHYHYQWYYLFVYASKRTSQFCFFICKLQCVYFCYVCCWLYLHLLFDV